MAGWERGEREWAGATGYQGSRLSKKNYQVSGKCVGVTNHKIFICDGRERGRGHKEEEQQLGELAKLGRGPSITWLTYLGTLLRSLLPRPQPPTNCSYTSRQPGKAAAAAAIDGYQCG